MSQLSLLDENGEVIDAQNSIVEALFTPNGRRKCSACRQPMKPFGGRLYCLRAGCTGVPR